MKNRLSRKERRLLEQRRQQLRVVKKGAAIVGTTMTACSLAAPFMNPQIAAAETGSGVAARTNTSAYISEIAAYAQPVANANDLYASVMIAQAIVESGWGGSTLSQAPHHNLFGIKGSYNGSTVYMDTWEYLNGQWVIMKEPFRSYPSFAESFADNAATLKNVVIGGQYYYRGAWKSNTSSYRDATAWLTGRYATAPNYASTLNNIIESYGLTRYDTPGGGGSIGGGIGGGTGAGTGSGNTETGQSTYTVRAGDSLWGIATTHGVTIDQLRSWNNLSGDLIHPGQVLIIKGGTAGNSGGSESGNTGGNTGSTGNNEGNANQTGTTYTVQVGDSVWAISMKYGISMADLCSWNNIQNNLIFPGQVLTIKGGQSSTPTPAPTPEPSNPGGSTESGSTYTVQAGDSVWAIANKYGISMADLCSWNNIQNNLIHPGQVLTIKGGQSSTPTPAPTPAPSTPGSSTESGSTYTVQAGDSVWAIANKYGISMADLCNWNNIQNNLIHPGQVLTIKGGQASTPTPAPTPAPTPSTPNNNGGSETTYTVQSGDSVWAIANKYGISMADLCSWNNIQNNLIHPGQQLIVKKDGAAAPGDKYTVKSGDSVWLIAHNYGISMDQLRQWNNIQNDFIYPGQELKVS